MHCLKGAGLLVLMAVVSTLAVRAIQPDNNEKLQSYLATAQQAVARKDFSAAAESYRKAVADDQHIPQSRLACVLRKDDEQYDRRSAFHGADHARNREAVADRSSAAFLLVGSAYTSLRVILSLNIRLRSWRCITEIFVSRRSAWSNI